MSENAFVVFRYRDAQDQRCSAPRRMSLIPRKGELVYINDLDIEHPRRVLEVAWMAERDLDRPQGAAAVTVYLGAPVAEDPPA